MKIAVNLMFAVRNVVNLGTQRMAAIGLLLMAAAFGCWAAEAVAAQPEPKAGAVNYGRPFEPPTRPAFIPLPPGNVEPRGWLRDWCLTARDGYIGHADEVHEAFRQAWAADYRMTGEKLQWPKGGWPYEGGGYWFDGLVRLGYVLHDEFLLDKAKSRLDVVVNNMNQNSILFLWWLDKNNPADVKAAEQASEWPCWASGLLGRAMAAYYAGSRDNRVLRALETAYSGDRSWVRKGWSLSNPWPAYETYTWTGNPEIKAALTELFTNQTAWNKSLQWRYRRMPNDKPWGEANDHGVHFLEGTAPWALGYLWTGNAELLRAPWRWYEIVERDAMQPHGVFVSDEHYGPTGAFRGTETCNVAGSLWNQILMLMVGGRGLAGDRVERAFSTPPPRLSLATSRRTCIFSLPTASARTCRLCPSPSTKRRTRRCAVRLR